MNNVILVGRLTKDPEIVVTESNKKRAYIVIAVTRQHKNSEGSYDTDFIRCILWNVIAEHACEYCKKGDVVGIKGRIETGSYTKDDETKYTCDIVAEKVSFLSSKKVLEEK